MQHSTTVSEAPCLHCRRQLLYAWDDGLLVRADALPLAPPVAHELRRAGRRVYVRTDGGHLVLETLSRIGTLRLVRSWHAVHICPAVPADRTRTTARQLEFDLGDVRPPARQGGLW